MESAVHAAVPLRVGKKMRKRRELDALVGGGGARSGRLLSASSDEGEPWSRRTTRRRRSRPFFRLAAALALCICVVSAATVMWLFVDVRRQIVSLRIEMDRVSTSSDSVGDALQVCHTAAQDLKANASSLNLRLIQLEHDHQELAKRVEQAVGDLAAVSEQLANAPKLADTPRRLKELQWTMADFGSQIKSLDGALNSTRKLAVTASSGVEEIRGLLHELDARTNETIANVSSGFVLEEKLKQKIEALHTLLEANVAALQTKMEAVGKPVSTVAPTAPSPATTSSTSPSTTSTSTTTTTTTTTPPPGPPAKPSVLQ